MSISTTINVLRGEPDGRDGFLVVVVGEPVDGGISYHGVTQGWPQLHRCCPTVVVVAFKWMYGRKNIGLNMERSLAA
jgi:hypothetical protein